MLRLSASIGLVVLSLSAVRVSASDALRELLLSEAPRAWKNYIEQVTSDVHVVIEERTIDLKDGGNLRGTTREEITLAGQLLLNNVTYKNQSEAGANAVVANSRYRFTVQKMGDEWRLQDVTVDATTDPIGPGPLGNRTERTRIVRVALKGLFIGTTFFPGMLREKPFRVIDVTETNAVDDSKLVKVQFHYSSSNSNDVIRDGYVVLDPARSWLIQSAQVNAEWSNGAGTISLTNKFNDQGLGFPTIESQRFNQKSPGVTSLESITTMKWTKLTGKPDENDFTLTAYGLPEPGMQEP